MTFIIVKYLIPTISLLAGTLAFEACLLPATAQDLPVGIPGQHVENGEFSVEKRSMFSQSGDLHVNEVMASNATTVKDQDGDAEDWIELYNAGIDSVNLKGYGLSDDYDDPYKWVFPDITIASGEYLLIWASGKDRRGPGSELHTNFSIAKAGEEIILTDFNGMNVGELPPTEIPTGISIGRLPEKTEAWYYFETPTPDSANTTTGYQDVLASPGVSHQPGFYTDSFDLAITHPDPDAIIYYTLDGSKPTTESPVYTGPIPIRDRSDSPNELSAIPTSSNIYWSEPRSPVKKSTVVRVRAEIPGHISNKTRTATYFIDQKGAQRFSLPVVSISFHRDHFFNDETGIYVYGNSQNGNFREQGRDWERPVHLEFFDEEGKQVLDQEAGVRIHGGSTRLYGQKSLRLYARNEYGDNRFYHRIFPDQSDTEYHRLLLRNSGNDWYSTMFRDAMAQSLIRHLNVDTQAYRPAILFLNGEYWGIHNFRERYDRHYLARVYQIDPDNIDLLSKHNEVIEGDNHHYNQMIDYLEMNDLGDSTHFEKVNEMIDLENFLDYYSAQIYYGNRDWPHNNIDFWRLRTPYDPTASKGHDGRWRWLLFDVDYAMSLQTSYEFNTLERLLNNDGWSTAILRNLLDNKPFKHRFINRIADHLNSTFIPERVLYHIDSLGSAVKPEISEHIARWGQPESLEIWEFEVGTMKNFAKNRPDAVRQHILSVFNIDKQIKLTVDISNPSAGLVHVNNMPLSPHTPGIDTDPLPWSGTYFQNIPVTLTADPLPGYKFSHWNKFDLSNTGGDTYSAETTCQESAIYSPVITLQMTKAETVTAVFKPDENATLQPEPAVIQDNAYHFEKWPEDAPAGSYPEHMAFVYMDQTDPHIEAEIAGFTSGAYNLDSRTRISGLGENGFAFINTGNKDGNPGYPGARLGGAVLALNTQDQKNISVFWEGQTVQPNSRIYNLRLQYRVGDDGPFRDVTDSSGAPVEYRRNITAGHRQQIGPVRLPDVVNNKAYVQLLWRYYYTGERMDEGSGQRSKMAVTEIAVASQPINVTTAEEYEQVTEDPHLYQNYPNPFNPETVIRYRIPESGAVRLEVYDILGQRVATLVNERQPQGTHRVKWDAADVASGVYICRLAVGDFILSRQVMRVK